MTQLRTSRHWKVEIKSFPTVYDMSILSNKALDIQFLYLRASNVLSPFFLFLCYVHVIEIRHHQGVIVWQRFSEPSPDLGFPTVCVCRLSILSGIELSIY